VTRDHEYKDPTNPDTLVSSTEHQKCMAVHSMRNDMCLHCQVAKKAKKEMLPSTKLYSERSRAPDASHEVTREHEYKDATDPDTLVPPEERQKAYKVPSSYHGRACNLQTSCWGTVHLLRHIDHIKAPMMECLVVVHILEGWPLLMHVS